MSEKPKDVPTPGGPQDGSLSADERVIFNEMAAGAPELAERARKIIEPTDGSAPAANPLPPELVRQGPVGDDVRSRIHDQYPGPGHQYRSPQS